ncbi:hypothetical protein ACH5RR_000412 [Cinchona calisaya]|uniref:Fe2OG dioxygenase domain-containing protein n=1 Tax=Cinchona calisaya TaxID=153742 RepID=A0ABD3B0T5_9GENT
MDHKKLQNLPVINFGQENLKPGTKGWSSACNNVRHALEEFGCFLAVYDKISLKLRDSIFSSIEKLFGLPIETKIKNTSDKPFFGYFGQYPDIPLLESLGIGDSTNVEEIKSFSKLMWPCGNDMNFCGIVNEYANLLSGLEQVVTKMVFESYGLGKQLCDSHIGCTTHLLRFNSYRVPGLNETSVGAQPHTDKSFITILDQNQVNGLEVKLKDDQWIAVDLLPSSFVVMAGDGLLAWSNNRIIPCHHRVTMKGNVTRYSIGLFSYHKGIIQIPQELIDEENPQCFKPFDHLGFLTFFAKQMQTGRLSHCMIKAYCGV